MKRAEHHGEHLSTQTKEVLIFSDGHRGRKMLGSGDEDGLRADSPGR